MAAITRVGFGGPMAMAAVVSSGQVIEAAYLVDFMVVPAEDYFFVVPATDQWFAVLSR